MTYSSWLDDNRKKVAAIRGRLDKLGYTPEAVVAYFDYDNMRVQEPTHCPLYESGTKCHDISELNCYLCGCPFFLFNDTAPYKVENGLEYYSKCAVDSRKAGEFIHDNKVHCNCAGCVVPHSKSVALANYDAFTSPIPEPDGYISILERVRSFQLGDVLGRLKIF